MYFFRAKTGVTFKEWKTNMEVIILGATIKILEFLAGHWTEKWAFNGLCSLTGMLEMSSSSFFTLHFQRQKKFVKVYLHSSITSEASYVCILSGQKLTKNAKNGPFWRVFENLLLVVK